MRKPRPDGQIPVHFRYTDLNGISRQKTVYGRTEKEALQKKKDFLRDVDLCLRVEEKGKTVSQWADEWLEVYKKPSVGFKSMESYSLSVKRLKESLGTRTLSSITQADLQKLANTTRGKSASAISKYAMTIKAIFQSAVDNRLIAYSPASGIKPPKGTAGTHRALSNDEIEKVYQLCLDGHTLSLPVGVMLFAGLRKGESMGFDPVTDVDTMLHVRRAVAWPVNQPIIKQPKSKAGIRSIPIFNQLKPLLDRPRVILSKQMFHDALTDFKAKCGVKFTPNDLRHTFCSLLYAADVDIKTAQLWMGHASPEVTLRVYTHLVKDKKSASTDLAMGYFEAIGNKNGNSQEIESQNSEIYKGEAEK